MEKSLSVVLDNYGKKSKNLMIGDSDQIDKFTTRFESSDEIRNYFKKEIEEYLKEENAYISACTRKNNGRIVTFEVIQTGYNSCYFNIKKVLYKKHLAVIDELIKNKEVIKRYIWLSRFRANELKVESLVSPAIIHETKNNKFKSQADFDRIKEFAGLKRNKKNFYEKVRLLIKAYESIQLENKNLPSIDELYKKLNDNKKGYDKQEKKLNLDINAGDDKNHDTILIDGISYLISDLKEAKLTDFSDIDMAREDLDSYISKKDSSQK